jgi:hypothetical protein
MEQVFREHQLCPQPGPLGPFFESYASEMCSEGYAQQTPLRASSLWRRSGDQLFNGGHGNEHPLSRRQLQKSIPPVKLNSAILSFDHNCKRRDLARESVATLETIEKQNFTEALALILAVHREAAHQGSRYKRVPRQLQFLDNIFWHSVALNAVRGECVITEDCRPVRHHKCRGDFGFHILPDPFVKITVERFVTG